MTAPGPWWRGRTRRLIQMNLRDIDADLDPDTYVRLAREYHAEVVLFNVGGIVANHPTRVSGHYLNPHLTGDLVGEVATRIHAAGLRLIARFDFSKVHESIAAAHPDWLYRDLHGAPINYNTYVHTCINGGYQQAVAFDILAEALARYPLDGVFFNMIGYTTSDYSGVYHGICQCANCAARYAAFGGGALPTVEDASDELFRHYDEFRRASSAALFQRLSAHIKACRPRTALATYTEPGVDIVVSESNSDPDRRLPEWHYSASDNVKRVYGSYADKHSCNLAMHFAGIGYRHAGVSPHLTELRLAQDIIHGGWAGFVVIGRLDRQDDRRCLPRVRAIMDFHARHAGQLTDTVSLADVCLVKPRLSGLFGSDSEYRGVFRILSEAAIPFDVIDDGRLSAADLPRPLAAYHTIVLPDTQVLDDATCAALDRYVAGGGHLLATGRPARLADATTARAACGLSCLGVRAPVAIHEGARGQYVRIREEDRAALGRPPLDDLDLVYLTGAYGMFEPLAGTRGYLRFVADSLFGPPESCYVAPDTPYAALLHRPHGNGAAAYFPWGLGAHYEQRGYDGHAELLLGALEGLLGYRRALTLEPVQPLLEVARRQDRGGAFEWLGLASLAGQNGTALHAAAPLVNQIVRIRPNQPVRRARLLHAGADLAFAHEPDNWLRLTIPRIERFEILLLDYV